MSLHTFTILPVCMALCLGTVPKPAPHSASSEFSYVLELVRSTPVMADVICDTPLYEKFNDEVPVTTLKAGVSVEILEDYSMEKYKVRENLPGIEGWVDGTALSFPEDTPSNKNLMSAEEVEAYVNLAGLTSRTDYVIFTDLERQMVHVLSGEQYNYKLVKSFTCASGKNRSPSSRGHFTLGYRGEWFYSERLDSGAMYWIRYNGNYLFHSVPMDLQRNVLEPKLGERISSGCIRLSIEDIKWIYDNVIDGTDVYIT